MCQGVNAAILAETKDLGFEAEIAVASVVEGVVLEAAGGLLISWLAVRLLPLRSG